MIRTEYNITHSNIKRIYFREYANHDNLLWGNTKFTLLIYI